jgi:hypothetical protein
MGLLGRCADRGRDRAVRIGSAAALHRIHKAPAERGHPIEAKVELDAPTCEPGPFQTVRDAVGVGEFSAVRGERREHGQGPWSLGGGSVGGGWNSGSAERCPLGSLMRTFAFSARLICAAAVTGARNVASAGAGSLGALGDPRVTSVAATVLTSTSAAAIDASWRAR